MRNEEFPPVLPLTRAMGVLDSPLVNDWCQSILLDTVVQFGGMK